MALPTQVPARVRQLPTRKAARLWAAGWHLHHHPEESPHPMCLEVGLAGRWRRPAELPMKRRSPSVDAVRFACVTDAKA